MELNFHGIIIPEIEIGDVVVASNGLACLVVDDGGFNQQFPIRLVNLNTCEIENGFPNLETINKALEIKNHLAIKKVIKSKNLTLSLKEV